MVPASSYNMQDDNRLLIPFTSGDKIGFVDKEGAIVVKPQFTMYYGDCYDESDNIRVSVDCLYGFIRSGGKVATYKRPMYGLINYKGETIFEPSFYSLIPAIGNKNLYTVQNNHFEYAVLNIDGTEVVPFGKYNWIDGFDNGLARVRIGNVTNGQNENGNKWGLIDENGKEILPLEYDNIWTFYGKKVPLTLCKSAAFAVKTIEFCVFEAKFWCKRAEYGASESPECEFRSEVSEQYLYTVIPP